MAGIEISRIVKAPIDRVFEVFTDLDSDWLRCAAIVKIERVTHGPVGAGTIFKETRQIFGRESTETMEFTEFAPPNRWVIAGQTCGSRFTTSFDLQPESEGTRLIVNTGIKALNPISWFLGLVFGVLFKKSMKRAINKDLDTLTQIAEGTWVEPEPDAGTDANNG
jgi:hypothetical protein